MLFLVDVQYYTSRECKVLKEACIMPLSLQHARMNHFVFKPPFPLHKLSARDARTANYLHFTRGMLHWNHGSQEENEFINSFPPGAVVLCSGQDKSLLIQSLLPMCHVMNIQYTFQDIESSVLPTHIICPSGSLHGLCALERVYQIYLHLML